MDKYIKLQTLSTTFPESVKKGFNNILSTKAKKTGILAFVLIIVLVGIVGTMVVCQNKDSKLRTAKEYILDNGYKVISNGKLINKYILTDDELTRLPYSMYFSFMDFNVIDECINKEVSTYEFKATNHPLENAESNTKKQTLLYVMLCDNKVVGGYSLPNYSEPVLGGVCSFKGETLEEVKGMDFLSWSDLWVKKYGSVDNPKDRPNLYYTLPHYSSMPIKALISTNTWGNISSDFPIPLEREYKEYLSIKQIVPNVAVILNIAYDDSQKKSPEMLECAVYLHNSKEEQTNIPIKVDGGNIFFDPPKNNGEYIYSVVIKFEKGTVSYNIKIVVEDKVKL